MPRAPAVLRRPSCAGRLAPLVQSEAGERAGLIQQRDVRVAAERAVPRQDIAAAEHPVRAHDAAHVVREQRQREHAEEQSRGGVEEPQQLGHRVADARPRARRQPEVFTQRRRVARREAGAAHDQHALPDAAQGPGETRIRPPSHPRQQRGEHDQRQPLPRLAVTGRREADTAELARVRHGGVAVQDLEREQPQRPERRQQRVAPGVGGVAAELIDVLCDAKIGERLAAQARERVDNGSGGGSHPWPPVGW